MDTLRGRAGKIFLPRWIQEGQDPEIRRKAVLAVTHGLSLAVFSLGMAVAQAAAGQVEAAVGSIGTATLMAVGPIVMRVTGSLRFCVQSLLLTGLLSVSGMAILTGGEGSPALFWLAGLPVLALTLGGLSTGLFWLVASLFVLSAFSILPLLGFHFPVTIAAYSFSSVIVVSQLGLIGYLAAVTFAMESSRGRSFGELKAANQKLSEARHAAEEASHAKTMFLATMSHELRTPLTAILGYSELLTDQETSNRQRGHYVSTIRQSGEHLLGVITEILDLSEIETERATMNEVSCDVRSLVEGTANLLRIKAEAKGLQIEVDIDDEVPISIVTDPVRFRQVLINLVVNGIKYTEQGHVRLRVTGDGGAIGELHISVEDSGRGMSPTEVEEVFLPFARCGKPEEGAGLGLTIAHRLVGLLGGRLGVDSTPGVGTTFRWYLPQPEVNARVSAVGVPSPAGESGLSPGSRVLLAEDNELTRALLLHNLESAGLEVDAFDDGASALERARSAMLQGRPYDAVVADVQMPEMDGCDLASQLRGFGFAGPILALTAGATVGERERCLAAGFSGFATKPISRARLLHFLGLRATAMAASGERPEDSRASIPLR